MGRIGAYSPIAGNANLAGLTQTLAGAAGQMGTPIAQVASQQAVLQQQGAANRMELAAGMYRNATAIAEANARTAAAMTAAGMDVVGRVMSASIPVLLEYYQEEEKWKEVKEYIDRLLKEVQDTPYPALPPGPVAPQHPVPPRLGTYVYPPPF